MCCEGEALQNVAHPDTEVANLLYNALPGGAVKIATRIVVFMAGVALLFLSWHKTHVAALNPQNPGTAYTGNPAEILVVIGAFVALLAFVPSSDTLGRWMSLKRHHRPPPAHFRRRRRT